MNGYRSGGPCAFCDEIAAVICLRCQAQVCERHRSPSTEASHCAVCAKEARDDADVAHFRSAVLTVDDGGPPFGRPTSIPLLELAAAWLGRRVFGRVARPESEPDVPFHERTPEQIRAWRRKAGVRMRG